MKIDPDASRSAVARAAFQAYAANDRAAIETLIAEDFSFTSPLDNAIDRATYMARCWPNHESLAEFDFIRTIENGDEVVVTYECETSDHRRFRNTEVLTVKEGKIHAVEVYFGWSLPHPAEAGSFVSGDEAG